jgi:hypothetical protein
MLLSSEIPHKVKCNHNKMVIEVVKEPGSQVYLESLKDFHGRRQNKLYT